jgi:5'-3' exonuclease
MKRYSQQVQIIMTELGKMEDEIFKARYEKEQMFRRRDKERKKREKMKTPHWTPNRPSTATNGLSELPATLLIDLQAQSNIIKLSKSYVIVLF